MHNLSGHHNLDKVFAVSILVALIFFAYLLFTNVYLDGLREIESEINLNRRKTGKVDSILANEKAYQEKIKKIQREYSQSKQFLSNNQPSTASSELQNKIKKIINTQSKAKILTLKPYPVSRHDGYSEVSVEIRMKDVSHEEIQNMLYKIEGELPLIIIREIDITRTQVSYKSILGQRNDKRDLNITLVASGFFKDTSFQSKK